MHNQKLRHTSSDLNSSQGASHNSQETILRTQINSVFKKVFQYAPDDELLNDLVNISIYFTQEEFRIFLQSQVRFNKSPAHITEKDGTIWIDHYYFLKKVLKEGNLYFSEVKHTDIGLENAIKLLTHTINATPYDFHQIHHDIKLLGRLFRICNEK